MIALMLWAHGSRGMLCAPGGSRNRLQITDTRDATTIGSRVLSAGDTIEIRCSESTAYCLTRSLTAAGDVLLPGAPPILLAKLTVVQASAKLAEMLEASGALAEADISVRIVPGTTKQVFIAGSVTYPETTFLGAGTTLQDLLASARATADADLRHVRIVAIDGETFIADSTARSWTLRAGDRVEVPVAKPTDEVLVLGGVERPGVLTLDDGMTVAEAVSQAGGVSALGTTRGWRVIGAGERSETIADFRAASTRRLQAGETVVVPYPAPPNFVIVVGAVVQPTAVTLQRDLHLRDALKAAGGASADADVRHVLVRSGFGKPPVVVDVLASSRGVDPVLEAGDSVVVPRLRVKARP